MDDLAVGGGDFTEGVELSADTGDFGADSGDGGKDTTTTETADAGSGADEAGAGGDRAFKPIVDGRLAPEVKTAIDTLRAQNPAMAEHLRRALFTEDRLRRELPQGWNELKQLRDRIETLGGDEGIQEFQAELDGWREFDQLYTAGDPKLLEFMMETPEGENAFLKLAPTVFEKFRDLHQDGYAKYVCQQFLGDMQAMDIPLLIDRLRSFLPQDNADAKALHDKLVGYIQRIQQLAMADVKPPKKDPPAVDPARHELETLRAQEQQRAWNQSIAQQHTRLFNQAWAKLVAGRKLPQNQQSALRKLYKDWLGTEIGKKTDFASTMNRYRERNQRDGAMRFHESTFRELVPRALRAAMAELGIGKPGAKLGGGGGPAATPSGKPAQAAPGFLRVASKPSMDTVNRVITTPEMWQKKQAVLKDGKRVTW